MSQDYCLQKVIPETEAERCNSTVTNVHKHIDVHCNLYYMVHGGCGGIYIRIRMVAQNFSQDLCQLAFAKVRI